MEKGSNVYTPRFCTVTISEVFADRQAAREAGYTEPTHYHKDGWGIAGRARNTPDMRFAAYRE